MDLLHTALKTFFYELMIKPSETYQQFLARFATAVRLLEEQEVKLPEVVLGYMLLKKLRLDAQSEAMLLTATKGETKLSQIVDAVKAVFAEGRGNIQAKNKEVFLTQAKVEEHEETDDELQEVMEAITDDWQQREDASDEDILEAFESYAEVRRKMAECWKARWKLTGSVNGRIELLQARTRCHLCKRQGHYKRECPMTQNKGSTSRSSATSTAATTTRTSEVHVIEPGDQHTTDVYVVDEDETQSLLQRFQLKASKSVSWKDSTANGVLNEGFADSHSTGNRQRSPSTSGHGLEPRGGAPRKQRGSGRLVSFRSRDVRG